jgi:hypothetical protein
MFLATLMQIIAAHRPAFRQERTFRRAVALLVGELVAFARHTVTQVLLALGMHDTDPTAFSRLFSRSRFDEATLTACLVRETLKQCATRDHSVIGIDSTQIPRSRLTVPGSSWLHARRTAVFKRGIHRAQRFFHCAWLPPREKGFTRAIPLRILPAFPPKAVPADVPSANECYALPTCHPAARMMHKSCHGTGGIALTTSGKGARPGTPITAGAGCCRHPQDDNRSRLAPGDVRSGCSSA